MTLTYDKLIRLAQALNVDIKDLLANEEERITPVALGRRSVTRAGEALDADSEKHVHHYPAADLLGKMMISIIIDVQARSVEELGDSFATAAKNICTSFAARWSFTPIFTLHLSLVLATSIYFDSGMAHGYVRTSLDPCTVLAVCAGQGIQQLADTASKRQRLSEESKSVA